MGCGSSTPVQPSPAPEAPAAVQSEPEFEEIVSKYDLEDLIGLEDGVLTVEEQNLIEEALLLFADEDGKAIEGNEQLSKLVARFKQRGTQLIDEATRLRDAIRDAENELQELKRAEGEQLQALDQQTLAAIKAEKLAEIKAKYDADLAAARARSKAPSWEQDPARAEIMHEYQIQVRGVEQLKQISPGQHSAKLAQLKLKLKAKFRDKRLEARQKHRDNILSRKAQLQQLKNEIESGKGDIKLRIAAYREKLREFVLKKSKNKKANKKNKKLEQIQSIYGQKLVSDKPKTKTLNRSQSSRVPSSSRGPSSRPQSARSARSRPSTKRSSSASLPNSPSNSHDSLAGGSQTERKTTTKKMSKQARSKSHHAGSGGKGNKARLKNQKSMGRGVKTTS